MIASGKAKAKTCPRTRATTSAGPAESIGDPVKRLSHDPDETPRQVTSPKAEQHQRHQPPSRRSEFGTVRDLSLLAGQLPAPFRRRLGAVFGHGGVSESGSLLVASASEGRRTACFGFAVLHFYY